MNLSGESKSPYQEICLWEGDILYSPTCAEGFEKEAIDVSDGIFADCPYCGKKIKYIGTRGLKCWNGSSGH